MDNEPKHITEDQWAKYFAGESSDEETTQIEAWRDSSVETSDLFLEYALLWEDLGALKDRNPSEINVDVDSAWESVKSQRNVALSPPEIKFPWFKIAASLIFVVGIFFAISQLSEDTKYLLAETQSETRDLMLSDGSAIKLNSNSSLCYPEKFEKDRFVELTGEAFFDIEHDAEKQFSIKIGEASVTVLGTAFNIKSSISADTVSVYVSRGKVLFAYEDQKQILEAGQKATLFSIPSKIELAAKDPSGLDEYWRTRKLTFSGQNLNYVANSLSQAYQQKIELSDQKLSNCSLSATFENDSLKNVLDVIALTLDLEISEKNQTIILSGEGCELN